MPEIDLHIISFNVPYPANYGGIIDVFYKLKNLSEAGLKIHLHCFQYGRQNQEILAKYASKVSYYQRPKSFLYHFSFIPYIVRSRKNKKLLDNLLADNAPILFEGLHTCAFLSNSKLKNRFKIVRTHNIEHHYYSELSKRTSNIIKKAYYILDSLKLKSYEKALKNADSLIAISKTDFDYFNSKYGKTVFIPPFHGSNSCSILVGKGDYALFHGNLSVPENYQMAVWLIEHIFSKIHIPLVLAGFNPDNSINEAAAKFSHIKIISNPTDEQMKEIISSAQVNLLFTQQSTGLKLKLLNALFNGRFCLCNDLMLNGTGIQESVSTVDIQNIDECIQLIESIFNRSFTEQDVKNRAHEVSLNYDNQKNTKRLLEVVSSLFID